MSIKPENRFWIGIYSFTAFIMLIAMGVFGWLAWTSRQEPGIGRVAGARASASTSPIPDERYELLAAFEAPKYISEPAAPQSFQDAMRSYSKGDFKAASVKLRPVANTTPAFPPAQFYLGISLLLSGDRIGGIQELRAVTESASHPYLERARFFLAKGLIAEHDIPRAEAQLEKVITQHGDLEKQATVLLSQIRPAS
jgi:predicted negative regulator of RcsB-dependent stress response